MAQQNDLKNLIVKISEELTNKKIKITPENIAWDLVDKGLISKKSYNTNTFKQIKDILKLLK
jgi:hypothetical protein